MNNRQEVENEDASYEYRPSDAYHKKELDYKKQLLLGEFKQADANNDSLLSE